MSTRWADWLRQAHADLALARHALAGAHRSVTEILDSLRREGLAVGEALLDLGRALDKLCVATRYPNGLPAGAPTDYYTRAEAERAISDAEAIFAWCERELPR